MKQKGLAPILIIFLIALGVGGYLVYQKQTKPTTLSQPTSQLLPTLGVSPAPTDALETANWKTYTNPMYKFSFDYPQELNLQEKQFPDYKAISLTSDYKPPFSNYLDVGVIIYSLDKKVDLKTWLDAYVIQELPSGKKGSIVWGEIVPYNIKGINGFSFVGGKESEYKYIFFSKGNNIFGVVLSGSGTGGSYKENKKGESTLDQILSTFKFQ